MIEIALSQVQFGIGELDPAGLAEDAPRLWKLMLIDQQSGITVSCVFEREAIDTLHESTVVDGPPEIAIARPKLLVPKGRNGKGA